jgi:hypothetical protein
MAVRAYLTSNFDEFTSSLASPCTYGGQLLSILDLDLTWPLSP